MEASSTYVSKNGFGHEEWLLNYEWLIGGRKFAHLQPVASSQPRLAGQDIRALLYTYAPGPSMLAIGVIDRLHVLDDEEAEFTLREFRSRGWLQQMADDLAVLGADGRLLLDAGALATFNVSFSPDDIRLLDPPRPVPSEHPERRRLTRYNLVAATSRVALWDVQAHERASRSREPTFDTRSPTKTATRTVRRSVGSVEVDLAHTRIQNSLQQFLQSQGHTVWYEEDGVDLLLRDPDGRETLLEIKTETCARLCIRNALGQLLEYAHYSDKRHILRLVVVGDARLTVDDIRYLDELRRTYKLPLEYWRYLPSEGILERKAGSSTLANITTR